MIKGTELENRAGIGSDGPEVEKRSRKRVDLAELLAAARALTPPDDIGCGRCFRAGRDAVVAVLEADGELADKIRMARAQRPKHHHLGDTSFDVGRDAAVAVVSGAA